MKTTLAQGLASLGGVGYLKPASGTWGSLATALLLFFFWPELSLSLKALIILLTFAVGCWAAQLSEQLSSHDPSFVVIDEAVGMMITSLFLASIWQHWLIAFLAFRLFDILKLWPASVFDRRPGGFAIMFDDVIMALPALALTSLLTPWF